MSDFIKTFWESQAIKFKNSHEVSWGDNFAIDLEIENIAKYIKAGDSVLDVGCSNGHATLAMLQKNPGKIYGIDYAEHMIRYAKENKEKLKNAENVFFDVGDIGKLQFEDETFDLVYTTRVLINLPNWETQIQGIEECIRVTKKGGTIILSEGFWEPLVLLNSLRTLKQLTPLVEHDFNRYLKIEKLSAFLNKKEMKFFVEDFSSIYYLGSRFLRELITNPSDYPGYSNPVNKIFYDIEKQFSGGGFGIQQAFIISK
ncbi:MAG TPA: methyltransferase domain-containing protein [Chitinophagaceae bacterium]|nr:methyltransferase domain-containing protein [Chitinophagaceae bacterium]